MAETTPVQLVDADGEFCGDAMDDFSQTSGLRTASLQYQIVAIMGPQSSGKSTLMNHLFGTQFQEMDAVLGRRQTTRGIWMARAPKGGDALTVLLDLEGTDGRERGEDDTTFERQSALFALAVSDVVLINIWCHDIGREHGSGKPLIKTILQVNLKLFTPSPSNKKTVLVFVIRDKSRTPLERLAEVLEQDMLRIWESIIKPEHLKETSFHDFFEVFFEALPNFEEKEEEFKADTQRLYKKFSTQSDEHSYIRLKGKLPGDAIPLSVSKVWEVIKSHKDLDLPAHKIMVATTRCSQIQHEQLEGLINDQLWQQLMKDAAEELHEDFGERASSLVDSSISGYDEDTLYFDADIRAEKRVELVEKVTNLAKVPFEQQTTLLHKNLFEKMEKDLKMGTAVEGKGFSECAAACEQAAKTSFTEKAKLLKITPVEIPSEHFFDNFVKDIESLIDKMKQEKIAAVLSKIEELFASVLSVPAVDIFATAPFNLWQQARDIISSAHSDADKLKKKELEGYTLNSVEQQKLNDGQQELAMRLMKTHAKEAANTVLSRMKEKFGSCFYSDDQNIERTWTAKDDIPKISKQARMAAAEYLAQLAIFQAKDLSTRATEIEQAIREMARKDFETSTANSKTTATSAEKGININIAAKWPEIPEDLVLIQPPTVRSNWRKFMADTKQQIAQATLTQHANKLASNRLPPIWAIFAMLLLGLNEFLAVIYSPVLALSIIVLLLFVRSLYIELDVDNEMQQGALPGAISLAGKFVPATLSTDDNNTAQASTSEGSLRRRIPAQDGGVEQKVTPSSEVTSSTTESAKDK